MKILFTAVAAMVASIGLSQSKNFSFDEIKTRSSANQWQAEKLPSMRSAEFSEDRISLRLERKYALNIVSQTHLPDDGIVFLCKDDHQREVTVVLISDEKMFLYDDANRYQVDFMQPDFRGIHSVADAD